MADTFSLTTTSPLFQSIEGKVGKLADAAFPVATKLTTANFKARFTAVDAALDKLLAAPKADPVAAELKLLREDLDKLLAIANGAQTPPAGGGSAGDSPVGTEVGPGTALIVKGVTYKIDASGAVQVGGNLSGGSANVKKLRRIGDSVVQFADWGSGSGWFTVPPDGAKGVWIDATDPTKVPSAPEGGGTQPDGETPPPAPVSSMPMGSPMNEQKVVFVSQTVPVGAQFCDCVVKIDTPLGKITDTVAFDIMTWNGQGMGERTPSWGGHFEPLRQRMEFRPGDSLQKTVRVILYSTPDGGNFRIGIPSDVDGGYRGDNGATITMKAGAPAVAAPAVISRADQVCTLGARLGLLDPTSFKASDSGLDAAGKPIWRNSFADVGSARRTQPGNAEPTFYTGPDVQPGTKAYYVQNGTLFLQVEKFAAPMRNLLDGQLYEYGACVLTAEKMPEWNFDEAIIRYEAALPSMDRTWPGLWRLPTPRPWPMWPPEGDDMEQINSPGHDPLKYSSTEHWGPYNTQTWNNINAARYGTKVQDTFNLYTTRILKPSAKNPLGRITKWFNSAEIYDGPNRFSEAGRTQYPLLDNTLIAGSNNTNLNWGAGTPHMQIRRVELFGV